MTPPFAVVNGLPAIGEPFFVIENVAPFSALPVLLEVLVILIAPSCCLSWYVQVTESPAFRVMFALNGSVASCEPLELPVAVQVRLSSVKPGGNGLFSVTW